MPPSHQAWDQLVKEYVTSTGKVNYAGIKTQQTKLNDYLTLLAQNAPQDSWSKEEKLAYWINLYNASTVSLILKNYPLTSIMKLDKPFDTKFVKSGNRTISLNQLENEIIRPTFKEPRIHFVVNCAAISCPKLRNEAYQAANLSKQLDSQASFFINSVHNKLSAKRAELSKIFDWYKDDFGTKANLISFINRYATQKLATDAEITYLEYNWNLNK
ncbi:MAG: DUF547 domain-containing protein [Bacteroidia bacterium]|nr:DUF547 domain-containing protein [Bacteroidia bacterium]